jgi:hypothetical protein
MNRSWHTKRRLRKEFRHCGSASVVAAKDMMVLTLILVVAIVVGTPLGFDGSMTLTEEIEPYQQSGLFPCTCAISSCKRDLADCP